MLMCKGTFWSNMENIVILSLVCKIDSVPSADNFCRVVNLPCLFIIAHTRRKCPGGFPILNQRLLVLIRVPSNFLVIFRVPEFSQNSYFQSYKKTFL